VSGVAEPFGVKLTSDATAEIQVDISVYAKEAVLKAVHWATDIAYVQIRHSSDRVLVIELTLKQPKPTLDNPQTTSIEALSGDVCNLILDYELRRQISSETAAIRQLILAKAFSEAGVLEDSAPGSCADPVELTQSSPLVQIGSRQES
jgi:His-Xaa-Ser system protein HxsD